MRQLGSSRFLDGNSSEHAELSPRVGGGICKNARDGAMSGVAKRVGNW